MLNIRLHNLFTRQPRTCRRAFGGQWRGSAGSEQGFTLVEVLVATALLVTIGVGLLGGLALASKILLYTNTRETARDVAEAQWEYLQSEPFSDSGSYVLNANIDNGSGFSSSISAIQAINTGRLQEITITVSQGGGEAFSLTGRKVNW